MEYKSIHKDIIDACRRGERSAQFELYRLYAKAMYNICRRMVRNEMDAEDLLQNSFVDVFSKLHTFKSESSIGAWIKRIVINNCINFLKKKKLHFDELNERHTRILEDTTERKGDYNVGAIKKAIFQLPDGYRVVFSLYQMEGYDHKEIANILDISEATSKSQYSRAKKKLRELLSTESLTPN